MSSESIFVILIVIVVLSFLFGRYLVFLNLRNMREDVPPILKDRYDREQYSKSQRYLRENTHLSNLSGSLSFLLTLAALLSGAFAWLDEAILRAGVSGIWQTVLFFAAIALVTALISIPFSVWSTFVIEEKYGFNRSTVRTFVLDLLKSALLGVLLGGTILYFITWLFQRSGEWFWVLAWGAISVFSLLMTLLYSDIIVPLFNKQKPLPEGELRDAIMAYAEAEKFKVRDIYVIDGSRRSSKANAYFSGFGPRRRIVLYDTLISDHPVPELVAILAHEVGHYRHRHVLKGTIISILETGLTLFILSLFIKPGSVSAGLFASALGAEPSFHIGVLVFGILYSPISTLSSLFGNVMSRRHEFQADAFAARAYSGRHLADALIRLSVKHLSNLFPHPLYVKFNYSHPPLLQRLDALNKPEGGIQAG